MISWLDRDERARRRQVAMLPQLLHTLSRSLRGGATLHGAMQEAAGDPSLVGEGFRRAMARADSGAPMHAEIDSWAAGLADRDADLVRAVINTGAATGSALAASLDRAAASLEERAGLRREISALTAQARASALLLTAAPIGFLSVMAMADPRIIAFATSTNSGRLAFVAGLLLDLLGWFWMRRLTAAVDP